ncbi:hypothetical protein MNB_SM-3-1384 [hydrothermal vent metagenome]|uniref:Lipoprotein n=1 Tax=hydrothermal vent metagenome TaxID=652676 RepID=A0A1W1D1Z6_9ZZZZ
MYIFHSVIIPILLLNMSGCGYKAPPFYQKNGVEDKNVVIIEKKSQSEKNN